MNAITQETKGEERGKNSQWQELAQPQTITQGGHEIASIELEQQNVFIFTYDETNTDKLGKYNKTPNKRQAPWWGLACCES